MWSFFPLKEVQLFCHRLTTEVKKSKVKKISMWNSVILVDYTRFTFHCWFFSDWKWIQQCSKGIQRAWYTICPLGRKHGCGARYWNSMDYVQAIRCPGSSGRFSKFHRAPIRWSDLFPLLAIPLRWLPFFLSMKIDRKNPTTMQINTCNGRNCGDTFTGPNSPNKPTLWTENWTAQ